MKRRLIIFGWLMVFLAAWVNPVRAGVGDPLPLVPGVDIPLTTQGLTLLVVGTERLGKVVDPSGDWTVEDPGKELLVVIVVLSADSDLETLERWFGGGPTAYPAVVDSAGRRQSWALANLDEVDGARVLTIYFLVSRNLAGYTLIFPAGVSVNLTLVPDLTERFYPSYCSGCLRAI